MSKTSTLGRLAPTICIALCLGATGATQAAGLSNGDFSGGLAGWSTAGNAAPDTTSAFGAPAAGYTAQAVMGTAATSGYLFGGSVGSAATLDTFTGLPAGTLAGLGAVVGSAIGQGFTSGAGDVLRFQWKFMSDEPQGSPANDLAFLVLDGQLYTLTTVQSASFLGSSASPLLDETAYQPYSLTLTAGAHTLSFGVVDVPDSLGASALAISGVSVAAVPEPGSWALMLGGLGGLLRLARRRSPGALA